MTIKLKAGEAAYALYKEETNEYVYLGGGNGFYGFKPYPKPTGMSTSIEKLEKKRDGLTARLQGYVDNGRWARSDLDEDQVWERCKHVYDNRAQFDEHRTNMLAHTKKMYGEYLAEVESFTVVKISVEKA